MNRAIVVFLMGAILFIPSIVRAQIQISGDIDQATQSLDQFLLREFDEFAGLTQETWTILGQFISVDPSRYEGVRTEENAFLFTFTDEMLKTQGGNPYFGLNHVFGGAITIDPTRAYPIQIGDTYVNIDSPTPGDLFVDVRVSGYEQDSIALSVSSEDLVQIQTEDQELMAVSDKWLVVEGGRVFIEAIDPSSVVTQADQLLSDVDSSSELLPYSHKTELSLLPDRTVEKILSYYRDAAVLELRLNSEEAGDAWYQASVMKEGKVFGLFDVDVPIAVRVDAVTERIVLRDAPWWDVFVF